MDYAEEDITYGACQRYLAGLRAEKKEESTKAVDRKPMRGRHSDMTRWKVRTPEMTEEEYQEAVKIYRRKLSRDWRKKNPDYHKKYNQKNYTKKKAA